MTDDKINELFDSVSGDDPDVHIRFARAIIAALNNPCTGVSGPVAWRRPKKVLSIEAYETVHHWSSISGEGWEPLYAAGQPLVAPVVASLQSFQGYLCRAWGETDLPVVEIVNDLPAVRVFIVREWLGDEDSRYGGDPDGELILPAVMEEIAEQDWGDGIWQHEFEIGGISVEPVFGYLAAQSSPAGGGEALTVWYGKMPESNGRTNWTAVLRGNGREHTIDHSEFPERVRYAADCVRHIIGELPKPPYILDYDAALRTPCHLCGGSGEKNGKPCWGLNFEGTTHEAAIAAKGA